MSGFEIMLLMIIGFLFLLYIYLRVKSSNYFINNTYTGNIKYFKKLKGINSLWNLLPKL